MLKLYEIVDEYKALEAMLSQMDEEEVAVSIDDIQKLLNPLNDTLERKLEMCGRYIKNLDAERSAIKAERERLQKREKSLQNKIDSIKSYTLMMLEQNGIQTIKGELLKVGWQQNAAVSVKVEDLTAVPREYLKEVAVIKDGILEIGNDVYFLEGHAVMSADKKAIGKQFKEFKCTVPGCNVEVGKHVRVR